MFTAFIDNLADACCRNDQALLKKVTCGAQQGRALKILAKRDPNLVYKWKFVKEVLWFSHCYYLVCEAN
jgi:hypothetical protein